MLTHLQISFLLGLRSRSFQVALVFGLGLLALAWLLSSFSGRHPAIVTLDLGLSAIRMITLILTVFWVMDLVGRDIERKTVIFSLCYPQDRLTYLLGRYVGIALLLLAIVAILGGVVYAEERYLAMNNPRLAQLESWVTMLPVLLMIWLDALVILAFTLLVATVSTSAFTALIAGISFALAARSLGPTLAYLSSSYAQGDRLEVSLSPVVHRLRYLLPDLSLLDIRAAALYGVKLNASALAWPGLMALTYIGILLSLAVFFFRRREFV